MSTFTIPKLFPQLFLEEAYNRQILKASLIRKIAMAQNIIWSKAIRIYANGGYEGHGYQLSHNTGQFDPSIPGNSNLAGASSLTDTRGSMYRDQEVLPDGYYGLCICSFLVPPNWGTSRRVLVQGEYTFLGGDWVNGELVNEADIWVVIYRRDGSVYSYRRWSDDHGGTIQTQATNEDFSIELEVPQDATYVARIFIQHLDHSTIANNTNFALTDNDPNHKVQVKWISARYAVANEDESNDPIGQSWIGYADFFRNDMPVSSAFLTALIHNTQYLGGGRPSELCQAWVGPHWADGREGVAEIGHYKFWTPSNVNKMKGKLYLSSQRSGAGNSIYVKLNGATIFTYNFAVSDLYYEVDVPEFDIPDGTENEITIEGQSSQFIDELSSSYLPAFGSEGWGVQVLGVSFWESATNLGLPAGTTVPATYQPIDEDAIEGDDVITGEDLNAFGQRSGLRKLFDNDRWLAANRLRHVIGDWRHRAVKRGGIFASGEFDLRTDWVPSDLYYYDDRMKNITIRGEPQAALVINGHTYTIDDFAGEAGQTGTPLSISGYSASPFIWPSNLTYRSHGRLLGIFYAMRPTGVASHISSQSNVRMSFYARRLRPFQEGVEGAYAEEAAFIGKGFLDIDYNGTKYQMPINSPPGSADENGIKPVPGDTIPRWLNDLVFQHDDNDITIKIRGRLPRQPVTINNNNFQGRPEGMLFEIELLGWYVADEPLSEDVLRSL